MRERAVEIPDEVAHVGNESLDADVGLLRDLVPDRNLAAQDVAEFIGRAGARHEAERGETFSRIVWLFSSLTISVFALVTMARGVPPGTTMPYHTSKTKPGSAASPIVGISGATAARFVLVTASTFSLSLFVLT